MKRLEFYVYIDFGNEKAKVLKSRYAPGVNEYVVKLIAEVPDPTPISVVTIQVPALVSVGEVQIVESQGINQALTKGWVVPTGTLDKNGMVHLEFTREGIAWLFSMGENEWQTVKAYGLDNCHYPQWYWNLSLDERARIQQGVEVQEDETPL